MRSYESINKNAEKVAEAIFDSTGEKTPSMTSLKRWVEENFDVKIRMLKFEDIPSKGSFPSGFVYQKPSSESDDKVYEIWINPYDALVRQRFTFCHEIGHIIKDRERAFGYHTDSDEGVERFCNRFAAAFLMPSAMFVSEWQDLSSYDYDIRLARVAKHFGVSGEAASVRVRELRLL